MNKINQKPDSTRDFIAAAGFFLILIPLLPVFLLGYGPILFAPRADTGL